MNDAFKCELLSVLGLRATTMNRLAFKMGVSQSFLSMVVNNKKAITRKTLASIIEVLVNDLGFKEDQLYRLAIVGCRRYLEERDLDKLCVVRPDQVMTWIHGELSYANKISIKQKTQIQSRIKARRSNG